MSKNLHSTVITDDIKSFLNAESEPVYYQIERQSIYNFSNATGDKNPLYNDEIFARSSIYGTLIVPPLFIRSLRPMKYDPLFPEPFSHILDAGSKFFFIHPIRLGDTICVVKKLVDIFEKDGKMGKMLFRKTEITFKNQFDQVAAKEFNTIITYGYGEKDPGIDDHG